MNANPWNRLPGQPPYVLSEDHEKVERFNNKPNQAHAINLKVIPIPFVGRPDAPVVLLGNIAGVDPNEEKKYKHRPTYVDRLRANLVHAVFPYPFFPLDPGPDTIRSSREWWTSRLEHLLAALRDVGIVDPECHLSHCILAVERFPYRSCSNEYHRHDSIGVVLSKAYNVGLVHDAMKRAALIVIRYGKTQWFKDVSGLERYTNLLLLKGTQQTHISPKGFKDPDGFQKVIQRILATTMPCN
jgi:hypothetical protein